MRYRFLRFPEGRAKAVTLSYDDGSKDDIRFLGVCLLHLNYTAPVDIILK